MVLDNREMSASEEWKSESSWVCFCHIDEFAYYVLWGSAVFAIKQCGYIVYSVFVEFSEKCNINTSFY